MTKNNTYKKIIVMLCAMFGLMTATSAESSIWSWLFGRSDNTSSAQPTDEHDGHDHQLPNEYDVGTPSDYHHWLQDHPLDTQSAIAYENYLRYHLGAAIPPMHELTTTARDWQRCGHKPYEVPPQELWSNIVPTLQLYHRLKELRIVPYYAQIRSVYRNPELNRCAGGAQSSRHLMNSAIDIWVAQYEYDSERLYDMKDALCRFWLDEGEYYNFGLGLYATGAIHIDTQGYRKWGGQYSRESSPCRINR